MKKIWVFLVSVITMFVVTSCNSEDTELVINNEEHLYGEWIQFDTDNDRYEFESRQITVTINPDHSYYYEDIEDDTAVEVFTGTWEYMSTSNIIKLQYEAEGIVGYDYCHVSDDFKSFMISYGNMNNEVDSTPFVKQ